MSEIDPYNEEHADGIVEDREQAPPVYFTVLFYGLIAGALIFMAWFLFSGWSSHDEFAEKMAAHTGMPIVETSAPGQSDSVAVTDGIDAGEIFSSRCAGCHGAKGEGAFGPDLTASSYKYGRSQATVIESITKGRPKSMPAFSGSLSEPEINALANYILAL
jgi:cytochrome c oxidase cbb3-type subunit 3